MGIKNNFNKFLKDKYPNIFESISLLEYKNKKIAIDTLIYINKYKAVYKDYWINCFIDFVIKLRKNKINCVFIFDSNSPPEKIKEREKRRANKQKMKQKIEQLKSEIEIFDKTKIISTFLQENFSKLNSKNKSKLPLFLDDDCLSEVTFCIDTMKEYVEKLESYIYSISYEDIEKCQEILEALDIPYIVAPMEAETLCSELCLRNKVDCVLSDDSDLFAYKCPIFLTKLNVPTMTCLRIKFDKILEETKLSNEQFVDFCILCGTDYNPGINAEKAFNYIKTYNFIEKIPNYIFQGNLERIRILFTSFFSLTIENSKKEIKNCGFPDKKKLKEYEEKYNINLNWKEIEKIYSL